MNYEEREKIIKTFLELCTGVRAVKGVDYSRGSDDVNANFKAVAEALNLADIDVLAVYYLKHVDAVVSYIRGLGESEPILGRLVDLVNYPLILVSLLVEKGVIKFEKDETGKNKRITTKK